MTLNRQSYRLANWDYSSSGLYFITICTHHKYPYFGTIINDEMILNSVGKIAESCWLEVPKHSKHLILDEFVIMPNHIHGILMLENNENNHVNTRETRYQNIGKNSISSIIGSYKSACSKIIRQTHLDIYFAWQPRFWDRIIRNDEQYYKIKQYIMDNPKTWLNDDLHIM